MREADKFPAKWGCFQTTLLVFAKILKYLTFCFPTAASLGFTFRNLVNLFMKRRFAATLRLNHHFSRPRFALVDYSCSTANWFLWCVLLVTSESFDLTDPKQPVIFFTYFFIEVGYCNNCCLSLFTTFPVLEQRITLFTVFQPLINRVCFVLRDLLLPQSGRRVMLTIASDEKPFFLVNVSMWCCFKHYDTYHH